MATRAKRSQKPTPTQARAARRSRRQFRRRFLRYGATAAVGAVALAFIVSLFAGSLPISLGGSAPGVEDHWHASYEITVCGETLPPFSPSPGGVHTHGDGQIHIHPSRPGETGSNANLALFFANSAGELTDKSLTLPSGDTYTNGDLCPDGRPGQLVVTVDSVSIEEPSSHVPQDGDQISITF